MPKVASETPAAASESCGHVNLHSLGPDGKPDGLLCTLPKGHDGDHAALHPEQEGDKIIGVLREWNDAAGKPVPTTPPPALPQLTMYQEELLVDYLRTHPGVKRNDAIAALALAGKWR